jgi:hypothetical protein
MLPNIKDKIVDCCRNTPSTKHVSSTAVILVLRDYVSELLI